MSIAIIKPTKVRAGKTASLRAVIDYIKDGSKTHDGLLVGCKDLRVGMEFQQMMLTKNLHHKTSGRQYAHFVQSFHQDDPITPEMALEIGEQFVARNPKFDDFQVVFAVHTNTDNTPIHYLINSVSTLKGEKWQCSPKDLADIRNVSDLLCKENGLSVIEEKGSSGKTYGETKGKFSWKEQLAKDVALALDGSFTLSQFSDKLEAKGIRFSIGERNIFFTVGAGYCGLKEERHCGNKKLMAYGDFSRENILNSIDYNEFNRDTGFRDVCTGGKILDALSKISLFEGMSGGQIQGISMSDVNFEGKTPEEIQQIIAEVQASIRSKLQSQEMVERAKKEAQNTKLLLTSIGGLLDEFIQWQKEKGCANYLVYDEDEQNQADDQLEEELEDEWEMEW